MKKILLAATVLAAMATFTDHAMAMAVKGEYCYCDWKFTPNEDPENPNPDCESLDNPLCTGACEGWCEDEDGHRLGGGYSNLFQPGQSSCQHAVTLMGNNIEGYTCETYKEPWPESGGPAEPE